MGDRRAANRRLMEKMAASAAQPEIERFQLSAKRFMAGTVPLPHFLREFRRTFGCGDSAAEILTGLHALLPSNSDAAAKLQSAIDANSQQQQQQQLLLQHDRQPKHQHGEELGATSLPLPPPAIPRTVRSPCCLVWLRKDMRVADNPALLAASKRDGGATLVLPIYIDDTAAENPWPVGGAQRV